LNKKKNRAAVITPAPGLPVLKVDNLKKTIRECFIRYFVKGQMKKPAEVMAGFSVYIERIRRLAILRQAFLPSAAKLPFLCQQSGSQKTFSILVTINQ
jgi:hypothetical protein